MRRVVPALVLALLALSVGASAQMHAFMWSPDGGFKDLGTNRRAIAISDTGLVLLSALRAGGGSNTIVYNTKSGASYAVSLIGTDINDAGTVCGYHTNIWGDNIPCVWNSTTGLRDLGSYGTANAINNAGQIVGSDNNRAVVWSGNITTDLGMGFATGINDAGQVAGFKLFGQQAFVWSLSTGSTVIDTGWVPNAIGPNGQVLGVRGNVPLVWRPTGGVQTLPFTGAAYAVNASGLLVGGAQSSGGPYAIAYDTLTGRRTNIARGWAYDVNKNGMVVGEFVPPAPVPEPRWIACTTLLLVGGLALKHRS